MRALHVSGQDRNTWTVNESGLYYLIFRSNKPEAKAFRKWVTGTVLPDIRKQGVFGESDILEKEKIIQEKLQQIDGLKEKMLELKENLNGVKKDLEKANNELHESLKTAPNQLKLF